MATASTSRPDNPAHGVRTKQVLVAVGAVVGLIAALLAAPIGGMPATAQDGDKVWVCKFVGSEREGYELKDGENPIHVSRSSTDGEEAFADAHPSFVVDSGDADCEEFPDEDDDEHDQVMNRDLTVDPDGGFEVGGTEVDLFGEDCGMGADTEVFFGDNEAEVVDVTSAEHITVVSPPGQGTVEVSAQTGKLLCDGAEFTYQPATMTIDPDEGPVAGGTEVTATAEGCDFSADSTLTVDGQEVDFTLVDSGELSFTTPAADQAGDVTVAVAHPDVSHVVCEAPFTYLAADGDDGTDGGDGTDGTDDSDGTGGTDDSAGGTGVTDGDDGAGGTDGGDGTTAEEDGTATQDVLESGTTVERVAGENRIETAVEVSQELFEASDAVVLARSDLYPDALTGGPFAHEVDAPLLLTLPDRLVDVTADEIERLGASTVYLLGEHRALSEEVRSQVGALDAVDTVERIGGEHRFHTAQLIAEELLDESGKERFERVYLSEGQHEDPQRGWPDAIAVSALASYQTEPILLTMRDRLFDHTVDAVRDVDAGLVDVVGGEAAISPAVVGELAERTGVSTRRELAGEDRYHTSVRIADRSVAVGMDPARLWLATGDNWPDGLVGGPTVAKDGGVLLLVPPETFATAPVSLQWIEDAQQGLPASVDMRIRVLGGPEAVSDEVLDALS